MKKIISGGQTGADRAALDAAIERGIPHGGWLPKGRASSILECHPLFSLILKLKNESVSSPPPGQFWKEDLAPLYRPHMKICVRYDFTRCTVQFIAFRAIEWQNMALCKMWF